jgi:hypothetical protein
VASNPASPCPSSHLRVLLANESGAGGSDYFTFNATNDANTTCAIGGYFGVSLYDPSGNLLSSDDNRYDTPTSIELAPAATVTFQVELDQALCNATSPHIGAFHLIPPNDTTFNQVTTNAGYLYCGPGTIGVSPDSPT